MCRGCVRVPDDRNNVRVVVCLNLIEYKHWERDMSQHPSLKSASRIVKKRNVLKRFERVDILREKGEWKPGDRAYGLPKTKSGPEA